MTGREARKLRERIRERRRQRRERKKVERQGRGPHRTRPRAKRIHSAVRKATLTAALTMSAARPGVPEAHARRGGGAILATSPVATLPDLAPVDDAPLVLIEPPHPSLLLSRNSRFDAHIEAAARKHGIAEDLVRAIIQVESGFEPRAVSPKGAKGLMQLMPRTARDMGARNVFDPRQNIFAGARYLRFLLDAFDGNLTLATAAYNAGPTNVQRHGGVPPFRETRDYVERVHALLGLGPPDLALTPPVQQAVLTVPGAPVESADPDLLPGPFRSRASD